ncbi:MAG: DNA polymerase I [Spirochaetia bacterium]|nr:DNA polymerase I [Spirochaetia bacterium]
MKRLLLVDTFGVFFRSYFAFGGTPLTNKKGDETSVLFGFFNTLYKLLNERSFDYFACVLDSPGPTFRHALDPEYKAHRPETPDSLKKQIATSIALLPSLGVPTAAKSGFEADDVIATLARQADKAGIEVEIFSSDKDLTQLVGGHIRILKQDSKTGDFITMGDAEVEEKWGVPPKGIIDLFALIGDTSDNVPGVKGVGPKTAVKLLQSFKTLDGIYAHLEEVEGKAVKEKLRENKDKAYLSQKLVTVEEDVKGIPAPTDLVFQPVDQKKALPILQDWELTTVIKRFSLDREAASFTLLDFEKTKPKKSKSAAKETSGEKSAAAPASGPDHALPDFKRKTLSLAEAGEIVKAAQEHKVFVFDIETTALDPFTAELVAIVFAFPGNLSYYIRTKTLEKDESKALLDTLRPILEDPQIGKIGHNLKFETAMLHEMGVVLAGIHFDTMIAAYFLDSNRSHYNLESLIEEHFKIVKAPYKEMLGKAESILHVPEETLEEYTYGDGEYTWRLYELQNKSLTGPERELFDTLDIKLIPVLAEMERLGVIINSPFLKKLSSQMEEEIGKLETRIHELAGGPFNVNSTKQLQEILFEKMKIKPVKKTKTGFSTDMDVLEKLSGEYEIANQLLRYRVLTKLKGTYVDALPEMVNPKTGRIHSDLNQAVAATGRLSSNNPNLQNIPIKSEDGRAIRRAFIAPPGEKIVSFDYSQVELRVLAQLSGDERLLAAYRENRDIHRETASMLFGVPNKDVNDDQRRIAKTINFSVIYGISAFSLSGNLKVTTQEAQGFINGYFAGYPEVRAYIDAVVSEARENKFVTTAYGRKRPIPDIASSQFFVRAGAERTAFNTVIQGTASDIIKWAMVRIHNRIQSGEIKAKLVMQVHDELVFYIPEKSVDESAKLILSEMKNVKPFDAILDAEWESGDSWEK